MDAKITRVEVLLDKLNMVFAEVKNDGNIDALELELLRKYTRQLAEALDMPLNTTIQPVTTPPPVEKKQAIEVPPPPTEIPPTPKMEENPPVKKVFVAPEEEIEPPVVITAKEVITPVVEEKVIPPVKQEEKPIVEEKPVVKEIPVVKETPVINESPVTEEKVIEAEKPVSKEPSVKKPLVRTVDSDDDEDEQTAGLTHKIQSGNKKTLADKISAHKAKDLKSVIPLNDKLSLTKILFKGDKEAYEQSIKMLNEMPSFTAAEQFIQGTLRTKYKWDDQDAIERLIEMLQLKFS